MVHHNSGPYLLQFFPPIGQHYSVGFRGCIDVFWLGSSLYYFMQPLSLSDIVLDLIHKHGIPTSWKDNICTNLCCVLTLNFACGLIPFSGRDFLIWLLSGPCSRNTRCISIFSHTFPSYLHALGGICWHLTFVSIWQIVLITKDIKIHNPIWPIWPTFTVVQQNHNGSSKKLKAL